MSECVVRMEMPTSCEECPLVQTDENDWGDVMSRTCNLIYKGYLSDVPKGERRSDCPIVCALPENHGRLVDIDRKFLRVATDGHGMSLNWRGSIAGIIDADNMRGVEIIVPAERSET